MCVSMRRKRSLRTGRAGDIFGQMGRRGDNTPLSHGTSVGHPKYYSAFKIGDSYLLSLSLRIVVIEYFLGKTSRRSLTVWNSGAQRDALWVVVPLGTQAQRSANVRPR